MIGIACHCSEGFVLAKSAKPERMMSIRFVSTAMAGRRVESIQCMICDSSDMRTSIAQGRTGEDLSIRPSYSRAAPGVLLQRFAEWLPSNSRDRIGGWESADGGEAAGSERAITDPRRR